MLVGEAGLLALVANGILLPYALKFWKEHKLLIVALVSHSLLYLLFASASEGWMLYLASALCWPALLGHPLVRAILIRTVAMKDFGSLNGVMAAVSTSAMAVSPLLHSCLFSHFVSHGRYLPNLPWFVASGIMIVGVLVALFGVHGLEKLPVVDKQGNWGSITKGAYFASSDLEASDEGEKETLLEQTKSL